MNAQPRVLIVEDEPELMTTVKLCLARAGYRVLEAADGIRGLEVALAETPDLIVLDVMMPGMSGFDVCAALRQRRFAQPILMLTTRSEVPDRVKGLGLGADDYLAKPFDARELLARIHALLRRSQFSASESQILKFAQVVVDLARQTATREGKPLPLTKTEFAIIGLLAATPREPVSREQLLARVWGYTYLPNTRTVDTHIWRLRKKLGDDGGETQWIRSVPGRGYALCL